MLSIDFIHRFISSLIFTSTLETLVVFLLLWFVFKKRKEIEAKLIVATGVLASFATIPYVWFVFPYMINWTRAESFRFSEPFVFLVEALIYRFYLKISMPVALTLSLLANAASYFIGPILRNHGLWIYW